MPTEARLDARPNGAAMQIYFPKDFAGDSQFPIEPGDEVIAQVADGGHAVVLTSVEHLADAYPVEASAPPRALLSPAECRLVYGDMATEPTTTTEP